MSREDKARQCSTCGEILPASMFYTKAEHRRSAKVGRRVTYPCRNCRRRYDAERQRPRREYADAVKTSSGCSDCGIRMPEHPEIYDFDHRDGGEKSGDIALMVTKGSFEDFKSEIEKCDVVCANCHRIRTRARRHPAFGKDHTQYRTDEGASFGLNETETKDEHTTLF